jgi:predicted transcriptional regulator of viral defense system
MSQVSTLRVIADLAEGQGGLFTRRQAETTGMAWTTLARLAHDDGMAERVAHGVYRLRGAPPVDHLKLRAAWLQLAPSVPAWTRTGESGVVSHRSAADLYGLGHLPADVHEFTLPARRQSRRPDVRLHRGHLEADEWRSVDGLLVTRPSRTAADLLAAREDPAAVGYVVADAIRGGLDDPAAMAAALGPLSVRFGLGRAGGTVMLRWLLELVDSPETEGWVSAVR